ncbi:MAG TPA: 1-acyl-sn-glycerol-3-phosphate acyltransferase [Thermoanaerobaculia bacterium]|jgi:1-acyl-sn-glycerol-3-phosphate acyltransferase|nr:1-acyl-sn-glycerol-3-phosphate acyltransferase [Thermoanaerobaculia bacterium]
MERTGEAERSYPGWVTRLARLLLRVFFGRIEVVGAECVPGAGREPARPLLYVANHNNGLVDPLLVLGLLPGRPRFLAKDTLWKNPVLRPFLALGRVIPIYRPQDAAQRAGGEGAVSRATNEESFRRCREVLEAGGAVALFPEGKSHSEPALAELKTGAARILLGLAAAARERVAVVPVGLVYDAPGIFRSRVLMAVGEPLVGDELGLAGEPGDAGAVRRVTAAIASGLEEVTLSHASWDEARRLARVADLWLQPDPELPTQPSLAERFAARRRLLARYRELAASRPERLRPLIEAVTAYDARLSALGLRDAQVGAAYPLPSVLRFLVESLVVLLIRLPLALIGIVLDYVPYRICGFLGALAAREPDQPATFKLFGGIVLFPLFWAGEAAYAGWRWGWAASLAVLVLGPLAGWVAIRFRDRLRFLRNEARAFLVLERSGSAGDELRRLRGEVRRELLALAAEVGETPPR